MRSCVPGEVSLNGRACTQWEEVDGGAHLDGIAANTTTSDANGWNEQSVNVLFSTFVQTRFLRIFPRSWTCSRPIIRTAVLILMSAPSPPTPPSPPPSPAFPLLALQEGQVSLRLSAPGELLRLVAVDDASLAAAANHWPPLAARSYDGEDWEAMYAAGGELPLNVSGCDGSTCSLWLPVHRIA